MIEFENVDAALNMDNMNAALNVNKIGVFCGSI